MLARHGEAQTAQTSVLAESLKYAHRLTDHTSAAAATQPLRTGEHERLARQTRRYATQRPSKASQPLPVLRPIPARQPIPCRWLMCRLASLALFRRQHSDSAFDRFSVLFNPVLIHLRQCLYPLNIHVIFPDCSVNIPLTLTNGAHIHM